MCVCTRRNLRHFPNYPWLVFTAIAALLLMQQLGSPARARLLDSEVIRPASSNASTVKALQERRLIQIGKGHDRLTIVWRLTKKRRHSEPVIYGCYRLSRRKQITAIVPLELGS